MNHFFFRIFYILSCSQKVNVCTSHKREVTYYGIKKCFSLCNVNRVLYDKKKLHGSDGLSANKGRLFTILYCVILIIVQFK